MNPGSTSHDMSASALSMTFAIQGCPQTGHERIEHRSLESYSDHFQLKSTLTWQFVWHCHIDFSTNPFISQVDEAFRGQGLGGLLIEAAEDFSKRSLDAT